MERKFAANFLEGEGYPRDGDSTELARARAELAALQNKFKNMGFVSGPVTYMEQIGPKRVILSETPSISAPMMPPPVRTLPPPPVEAPVRSNESTVIFELTKTLISLIQESKKEQREHNARLEAMMRNMRPIAVHAPPMQQGLAPTPALGGAANNLNVKLYEAADDVADTFEKQQDVSLVDDKYGLLLMKVFIRMPNGRAPEDFCWSQFATVRILGICPKQQEEHQQKQEGRGQNRKTDVARYLSEVTRSFIVIIVLVINWPAIIGNEEI
ncbi:hypothetical protein CBR_g39017 [Chara braunii]|uniref:Uncharacterized protein n=1 Tax=Chara braunii TaxID=69332 RepID=A0A388LQU8_CHABU|nr:hypothetical protein CBR_g39017 [Chara braunii]|eukprot:GBG84641.1 hypothetical protein CBR_g39017 [Chara braunii]